MRKLLSVVVWMPIALTSLIAIVVFYATSPYSARVTPAVAGATTSTMVSEAFNEPAPVPILPPFESSLVSADARPKIIASFLKEYNCPLIPYEKYADKYVEVADKYNLDFRLVPAISMQESNCCKRIPGGSNNCWGYGIYGDQVIVFPSIEVGIETVAKNLAKNYTSQGLMEPEEIMRKYTPQSKGSWAAGVLHFMNVMK